MSQEAAAREEIIDLKLVSDIIVQLNIVRKNSKIYPTGHPRLHASLERVLDLLAQHFSYAEKLSLGITRESLLVGERELPRSNPIFAEFAKQLHERSVFSLTLTRGIDGDQLLVFNRALSPFIEADTKDDIEEEPAGEMDAPPDEQAPEAEDPTEEPREKDKEEEGKKKLLVMEKFNDPGLPNIQVGIMNWENYEYVDVEVVDMEKRRTARKKGGVTWDKYVRKLMAQDDKGALTDGEDGVELTDVDPEMLAAFLKKLEKRKKKELSYDKVIATYMRESNASATSLDTVKDTEVKTNFVALANDLNPGLRKEILSEAFKFSRRAPGVTVQMLDKEPVKAVFGVMEKLNFTDRKINTRVFDLVDKLSPMDMSGLKPDEIPDELDAEEEKSLINLSHVYFTTTDFPESEEPENRIDLLEEAIEDIQDRDPDKSRVPEGSLENEVEENISSGQIGKHAVWVLLDLLEGAMKQEDGETYASAIADLMNEYTKMQFFGLVVDIWNELDYIRAANEGSRIKTDEYCYKAQIQFWHPENISLMASAILEHGLNQAEALTGILLEAGPFCAEQMVEVLGLQEKKTVRRVLTKIVVKIKDYTLPHVVKRLDDENWFMLRNMLQVIQAMEDETSIEKILALVEHEHTEVRLEALRTLVALGHPDSTRLVIQAFDDPEKDMAHGAIAVAGGIYDGELIRKLLEIVTARRLFKKDFDLPRKIEAVKALGRLAPDGALGEFFKIISTKRTFNKEDFQKLNLAIYKNLGKFDMAKVEHFIQFGLQSQQMEIINICRGLQDRTAHKRLPKEEPKKPAKIKKQLETKTKEEEPSFGSKWRRWLLPKNKGQSKEES